jgi:NADPH-dependent curcumin reductase CurA
MDAVLLNLALHARVVLCGLISEYNAPEKIGIRNLWQVMSSRRRSRASHRRLCPPLCRRWRAVAQWLGEGRLRVDEDIQHGLDNAYDAFMRLFTGANTGKLVLAVE